MYTTETKLVLFKPSCYKFKMLTVISKVTTKNIAKEYRDKEGNQNNTVQKIN